MKEKATLKRAVSLPFLVFYGTGTIIGGGIYALLGEVVGSAGFFTPISLFIATLIALFSALSYAELSSRYPVSAGEAHYVKAAFSSAWLSQLVGWLVILTGVVSTATLTLAIARFLVELFNFPTGVLIVSLVVFMGLIAMKGIKESVWFSAIITIIEVGGLLFIIYLVKDSFLTLETHYLQFLPPLDLSIWYGIFMGSFLIFYAFIGFEDMVNIAQEIKDVKRVLPKAIIISIAITFVIYFILSLGVVLAVDMENLANAKSPLALIAKEHSHIAYLTIWSIGVLAGVNGALIQIIMASRVLYGISSTTQKLHIFSKVNRVTQTPIYATLFIMVIVLVLSFGFNLVVLAKLTSTIVLTLFMLINLALITIKKRNEAHDGFTLPLWLPYVGFITSFSVLALHIVTQFFK
jgi:amino acid transporter